MGKHGQLEWVEGGKVVSKSFEAIVVQYPSGMITTPQKFEGRLILATDTTERPLLVLAAGTTLSSLGEARGWRRWPVSQTMINRRVGLFAWAVLLGAAIYKNLSHFFGF